MSEETYRDIGAIKNKWFETKDDYLDMSLNIIGDLQQENQQLKERVAYLERSNDRKEETIIDLRMEQELDLYKSALNEVRDFIGEPASDFSYDDIEHILELLDKVGDK